ncbi:caspase family protein [Streptomyces sp. S.PB5]|uniref:caspase family protein n=1 Tax=Streptomyces sp. S.PB5 TaxID=3020844 RepID=UPI0025AF6CEB|nr:caspase family protein [Streptomyces sp. S.PB5]MDN3021838.1 caspase family protein [Streptomyces sp. S.PB5]
MRTVYALFVGIDDYPGRHRLRGCVNDARDAESWLRRQSGRLTPVVRTLHDRQASRAAVLAAVEQHLGRSGPQDTALFWFSGHGSEHRTDDPREATGWAQALACQDSLEPDGQPMLQDTELGALLDGIAARGTHVVAILDCCHSGGATRESGFGPPGATGRGVAWQPWWPVPDTARDSGGDGPEPARHVLLAACRPRELAHENDIDGRVRGYFSHALLGALDRLGPSASYGALHALAEERVRSRTPFQHPELRGPEDGGFLSGTPVPSRREGAAEPFLLRHTTSGWEVNCGQAHGLRAAGAEFTLLGGLASRTVVVRQVQPEYCLVEPQGWQPGPDARLLAHPVTPTALAFTPAAVTLAGDPAAVHLLTKAMNGVPALAHGGYGLPLRVDVAGGWARVSGGAGHPVPDLPLRSRADAGRVVDCLAHLARWHHILELHNPDPWLSSLVRVTVERTSVGGVSYGADGEIVCGYTMDGREPQVKVGIHNTSDRQLWCVLLDLTDGYACSPHLYEGEFVAPGKVGLARRGEPVYLRLPPGRALVRGAFARDWLKVIVTENELNLAPFRLPAWPPAGSGEGARGEEAAGGGGLLRLTAPSYGRDAGGPVHDVGRWGTAQVVVRTEVT